MQRSKPRKLNMNINTGCSVWHCSRHLAVPAGAISFVPIPAALHLHQRKVSIHYTNHCVLELDDIFRRINTDATCHLWGQRLIIKAVCSI